MKEIPLSQNKVAVVDDDMYDFLMQWKWSAQRTVSGRWYATRKEGFPKRKVIRMHRVVANAPDGVDVDHKDLNGLHNWRNNLRLCNDSQNGANRPKSPNKSSPYKGVSWHKTDKKYHARITINKKIIQLGRYSDDKEAARAYNKAAQELFGPFARLNIIT
jgi:hypothetical protein